MTSDCLCSYLPYIQNWTRLRLYWKIWAVDKNHHPKKNLTIKIYQVCLFFGCYLVFEKFRKIFQARKKEKIMLLRKKSCMLNLNTWKRYHFLHLTDSHGDRCRKRNVSWFGMGHDGRLRSCTSKRQKGGLSFMHQINFLSFNIHDSGQPDTCQTNPKLCDKFKTVLLSRSRVDLAS